MGKERKIDQVLLACVLILNNQGLIAYELGTHARITLEAYKASVLNTDLTLLPSLGIPSLRHTSLGAEYYDVKTGNYALRNANIFDYDKEKMPGVAGDAGDAGVPFRVSGWLMRGAIREDDGGTLAGITFAEQREPQDDPYGNFNRFCNHFFDPLNNRPLTLPCLGDTFATAPVWASGAINPFVSAASVQEDGGRRNHFTLYDAREAMWRALTGYNKGMQLQVARYGTDRKAYWATTFRALGDVLHLNQDMAQPQHTRDESHGLTHAADYEKYIDARAKGENKVMLKGLFGTGKVIVEAAPLTPPDYAGYALPRFAHYSSYWSTGTGQATLSGKGLADYSSRGFFTPASNFGNTRYPSPTNDMGAYTRQVITNGAGFKEEYLLGAVYDAYTRSSSTPIRMARRSLWDDALGSAVYTLDLATYDDRSALLLPRAVAYSAGLLDYFFNGRLKIELPTEGAYAVVDHVRATGFPVVRLKLTNVTPPLLQDGSSVAQNMISGTAVAVVKYHTNSCYQRDLSGEYGAPGKSPQRCREKNQANTADYDVDDSNESIVVSKPLALSLDAGETVALAFDFSLDPIPLNASDLYLQVIYRGTLGTDAGSAEQDVVVVGTKDISEPTYFSYFNASDYISIAGKVYTRQAVEADQRLMEQVQPRSCLTGPLGSRGLNDACLNPFTLSLQLSFGNLENPTVRVEELPSRRFLRFAFLTDAADAGTKSKSTAGAAVPDPKFKVKLTLTSIAAGDQRKALLYQQSTCYPLTPFDLSPVENQLHFNADALNYHDESMSVLRGIQGYQQAACVLNGDGSVPGADDDREAAMAPLDDRLPFGVIVNAVFLQP